ALQRRPPARPPRARAPLPRGPPPRLRPRSGDLARGARRDVGHADAAPEMDLGPRHARAPARLVPPPRAPPRRPPVRLRPPRHRPEHPPRVARGARRARAGILRRSDGASRTLNRRSPYAYLPLAPSPPPQRPPPPADDAPPGPRVRARRRQRVAPAPARPLHRQLHPPRRRRLADAEPARGLPRGERRRGARLRADGGGPADGPRRDARAAAVGAGAGALGVPPHHALPEGRPRAARGFQPHPHPPRHAGRRGVPRAAPGEGAARDRRRVLAPALLVLPQVPTPLGAA